MAHNERNGRNVALPEENRPSWRPQDMDDDSREGSRMRDLAPWDESEERRRDDRLTEGYGQGQSGYAAGRYEGDRSYGSRNQANRYDRPSQDLGRDERWAGGRGGESWSPTDRDERGMYGSRGHYGDPGNQGYRQLEHGAQQYGQNAGHQNYGNYQQSDQAGGRGVQGQGGMYGQGGYEEGMHGRGGQQDRYGSSGYQGWGQSGQVAYGQGSRHGSGQSMHDESFGTGRIQGSPGMQPGTSGMGYGQQPEHQTHFGIGVAQGHQGTHYGQGPHRGKGPRGYTRSDERIHEMVCEVLTDNEHIDASNIDVAVQSGEVTLTGFVEDRGQKRLAEDIVERLPGVKDVQNQLRVGDRGRSTFQSASNMGTTTGSSMSTGNGNGKKGPAVEESPREQAQQSGSSGSDKRGRA